MKEKKGYSRREFLGRSMVGALGAAALARQGLSQAQSKEKNAVTEKAFIQRTLGRTSLHLPVVSMGVMNADMPALLRRSYEMGIRHFDTAASYQMGRNEQMVGRVLKELGVRDQVIISTKVLYPEQRQNMDNVQVKEKFLQALEGSLKRLQTPYVDIIYIHDVSDVKDLHLQGLLDGMTQAKKEKKARFVGFTTHVNMTACLNEAAKMDFYDVILTTFNYSLSQYAAIHQALEKAAQAGIGLIAMKTQCQQDWYREELPPEMQEFYRGNIVNTALLKWVLNHEFITTAVPGFVNFEQLETDITCASDLTYSPQEKKFLADKKVIVAMTAVCRQCGECRERCPKKADIPSLLRAHMYAANYRNFPQARQVLSSNAAKTALAACLSCNSCQAYCSQRVHIDRRIAELKLLYG